MRVLAEQVVAVIVFGSKRTTKKFISPVAAPMLWMRLRFDEMTVWPHAR
jgi:hypothetical protein